jgi:MFS family permease
MVAPAAGAEHEPDDDRGEANNLIAGDIASGYIGWTGDVDVWKISIEALSARNALDIELSAVEGVALSLEISDGVGQVIATRKGPRGAPLVVRGFVPLLPQGAPPFHYLTVKGDRSNSETAYQLRAVAKVIAPDAEIEPNDTPDTAMPVPADRKSLHAHWSAGDVDCFAVAPEDAARVLEVSIDTPNELDLAIDVLVEGKVVAKVDHPGKGAAEKVSAPMPAGAHAVIRVRGADAPGGAVRAGSRHRILAVLALTNLVSYAARNALFAVYPALHARFDIDDAQIGLLQTVFMIPHAAATLPFGWAGDAYDRRRVILSGLVLASVAGALGGLGHSYTGLALSRACVGLGTAAVVPVANSILSQIFEGPHKASRLSIFNLGLFVGGVTGFATGLALGFPWVVVALAAPGVVLAALIARLPVPAHAAPAPSVPWWRYVAQFATGFVAEARSLLAIRTLRWVTLSTTAMAFAAGGYNAWLKEFLTRDKHLSDAEATRMLVLALFAGLGGILVGGRIADRLRARAANGRLWTIVIGMSLTVPCAILAIELPAGIALYAASMATMFFISWYHAPMAASVDDLAPARRSVAAQGLVIFTMHMLGTAPASWVIGEVSERSTLHTAMWVPTFALVLAALCMAIATVGFAADHARARAPAATPG